MLADQFNQAAADARSYPQLEEISRLLWRAHEQGAIPDADAQAVAEAVQARRGALASTKEPCRIRSRPWAVLGPRRGRQTDRRA